MKLSNMRIKTILAFIDDVLYLPYRQIKFLCELFVCQTVQKPALYNGAVSFGVPADDPFIDQALQFCPG